MYKPIPPDCNKIYLDYDGCGDECYCQRIKIRYELHTSQLKYTNFLYGCLWESSTINWYYDMPKEYEKDVEELKKEVTKACNFYGITPDFDGHITCWTGERKL